MDFELSRMLVLELIHVNEGKIPAPLSAGWEDVEFLIKDLCKDGLLDESEDAYSLTREGKKRIYLFNSEREEAQSQLDPFENVLVDGVEIDARIPVASYIMWKYQVPEAQSLLESSVISIAWKKIVEMVAESQGSENWAQVLKNNMIFDTVKKTVSADAWKELGKTEEEAKTTAQWLLNPWGPSGLVQING